MAAPTCTFCQQYQAVYMGTSLEDGETMCACGNCLPGVMLGMCAAIVRGMTPDEAEMNAEALDAILAVRAPAPAPAKRSGKRSGPSEAKSEPTPDSSGHIPGELAMLGECPNCGDMVEIGTDGSAQCGNCSTVIDPMPVVS